MHGNRAYSRFVCIYLVHHGLLDQIPKANQTCINSLVLQPFVSLESAHYQAVKTTAISGTIIYAMQPHVYIADSKYQRRLTILRA